MTPFDITSLGLTSEDINAWEPLDRRYKNWPVVYLLDNANAVQARRGIRDREAGDIYVGESRNAAARMRQHLGSETKKHLTTVRVIIDETFNKSVCIDLESFLIRLLAGDGHYQVLNGNQGVIKSAYYERERYQQSFERVFEQLKNDGVFIRSIPEIENSDLFKLSPFKALTQDQAVAVEGILEGLFADLESTATSTSVIQGEPGTGKTVIAIYMLKLLVDIAQAPPAEEFDSDSLFAEFFVGGYPELLAGLSFGLVVPQQSLRESIKKVFRKTPGLHPDMVMTAFDVGASDTVFDLLLVDEAHRLNQRANQSSGPQNKKFGEINEKLFGRDDTSKTQLDWIRARSRHQIFLVDAAQSVRPADVPLELLNDLVGSARAGGRLYPLMSQMRVAAGDDYVGYVRRMLGGGSLASATATATVVAASTFASAEPVHPQTFEGYDFRVFDSVAAMRSAIGARDAEVGLSRLLAGYAWEWKSRGDSTSFDIEIDGTQLRWNSTQTDWIASPGSLEEVGSIHTVQGYDLNYAGVIIGRDLRYDPVRGRLFVDRSSYFDKKGKENNPKLGLVYSDDDLLRFVSNIYAVLLTRGIRGTYVFVQDAELREYLGRFIPSSGF